MINTNLAVQLGLFYSYLPFMVLPIYASVERYNFTLSEAAADLYATKWTTLRRIFCPQSNLAVIAGCILVFVPALGLSLRLTSGRGEELHDRFADRRTVQRQRRQLAVRCCGINDLASMVMVILLSCQASDVVREWTNECENRRQNLLRVSVYNHSLHTDPLCTSYRSDRLFVQRLGIDHDLAWPLPALVR